MAANILKQPRKYLWLDQTGIKLVKEIKGN